MIAKILVPVDFSNGSAAALQYAEGLAATVKAVEVKAIHIFTPQTASADAVTALPVGELMENSDQAMRKFLEGVPTKPGVNRTSELLLGFAADRIVEEAKEFDLIVMGASGETDLLEEVFGTVSSTVVENATCPVLLVPNMAKFSNYRTMLYASNNLSLSRRAVLEFREFNDLFHARVHFVHVKEDEDDADLNRQAIFSKLFATPDPSFSFDIREIEAASVQDGLKAYLDQHQIDLAVMVTKRRGFWGKLFHHSDTKQMILHPSTPLLVLHLVE